jgi:Crp-like helix-turn-helix domain
MARVPSSKPARPLFGGVHPAAKRAAEILATSPTFEVGSGEPYFRNSFSGVALLAVERGFVVLRNTLEGGARSIVTCEAGPGQIMLPPSPDDVLVGLVPSRLIGITEHARDRLLEIPEISKALLDLSAAALSRKQEALANFGHKRHIERVRHKLLQLAESYGRVSRDGIRIDFPVSHTLLADMIGSTRETVTRSVDELQRTGFVARRGHTYRLLISPARVLEQM